MAFTTHDGHRYRGLFGVHRDNGLAVQRLRKQPDPPGPIWRLAVDGVTRARLLDQRGPELEDDIESVCRPALSTGAFGLRDASGDLIDAEAKVVRSGPLLVAV